LLSQRFLKLESYKGGLARELQSFTMRFFQRIRNAIGKVPVIVIPVYFHNTLHFWMGRNNERPAHQEPVNAGRGVGKSAPLQHEPIGTGAETTAPQTHKAAGAEQPVPGRNPP
jgi:hypothetical protein